MHYIEAYSEHLNWFKSDHIPIFIRMGGGGPATNSMKRFKFVTAWITKASFKDLIKDSWCKDVDWTNAITHLTDKIIEWNKTIFGDINRKKRRLIKRLNGIDKANPDRINHFLNRL